MSTRSNIVVVKSDNKVHQLYHHCDGYLSGVGEDLRRHLVYSIGMNYIIKDIPSSNILISALLNDNEYEDEYEFDLNDLNHIHSDTEFTYVVKDSKLYYVYKWDLHNKVNSFKDLIDYVCKDENEIDLTKKCRDKE